MRKHLRFSLAGLLILTAFVGQACWSEIRVRKAHEEADLARANAAAEELAMKEYISRSRNGIYRRLAEAAHENWQLKSELKRIRSTMSVADHTPQESVGRPSAADTAREKFRRKIDKFQPEVSRENDLRP